MDVAFPAPARLGLGVGLDLPWGAPIGFGPDGGDRVADKVVRFLDRHAREYAYLFVSWQPRSRNRLDVRDYGPAFDDLFARVPVPARRALHHTALNTGALEPYARGEILDFTNALVERYGFLWVNEDLGVWSLGGKPLPYPLPPWLTDDGLRAAIRGVDDVKRGLSVPFVVEFPGFTEGGNFYVGRWHAYDFFRRVVEETGSPCNLDVGHLISWQWLHGRRGEALYDELDRLPLAHCFEVHLSGCQVIGERFVDAHHGILLDEQLELLARMLPMCPNLRAITYEDPKFDDDGALIRKSVANVERLRAQVAAWPA
jgi:uncharacterized protein (UPF0276 family)